MIEYIAPSASDLQKLKKELGFSGAQMAELASVASGAQWRKYTNGDAPRKINLHMLFFIAARLELSDEALNAVVKRMRLLGATINTIEALSVISADTLKCK